MLQIFLVLDHILCVDVFHFCILIFCVNNMDWFKFRISYLSVQSWLRGFLLDIIQAREEVKLLKQSKITEITSTITLQQEEVRVLFTLVYFLIFMHRQTLDYIKFKYDLCKKNSNRSATKIQLFFLCNDLTI